MKTVYPINSHRFMDGTKPYDPGALDTFAAGIAREVHHALHARAGFCDLWVRPIESGIADVVAIWMDDPTPPGYQYVTKITGFETVEVITARLRNLLRALPVYRN